MTTEINDIDKAPSAKHPGGRPISVAWRFNEDGTLACTNPTKHDYNINYYKEKAGCKAICNLCNREAVFKHMKRHQSSKFCMKHRNINIC